MPLFFFISGFTYKEKQYQSYTFRGFVKKKAGNYLTPYFVMCGINLILQISVVMLQSEGVDILNAILKYLFGIIYSYGSVSVMPNCTPLCFLPCLLIA